LGRGVQPPAAQTGPPAAAALSGEPSEERLPLPPGHTGGILAALSPLDLSALEAGMRAFLKQLERLGVPPAGSESGLSLWLIAGAAAVTACEMARRQLRRTAGVRAAEDRPSGFPLDPTFAG
jgi:hypothetical protein